MLEADAAEEVYSLEAAQACFKHECQKPGAKTTQRRGDASSPGKVVVIPGDHVFCSICAGESEEVHRGARIHLLSGEHAKRTLETCKMLVTDNPLLGQMKTGALVRLRKHFFKSQSQPCSLKMDPVHLTQESQQKRRSRPLSLFSGEAENLS